MRAIVLAAFGPGEKDPITEQQPTAMRQLLDRPIVQWVVEALVEQGCQEFDFILHEHAAVLQQFLGQGERWGSTFRYHLAKDPALPYRALRNLSGIEPASPVVLARGDCLPGFDSGKLRELADHVVPTLFTDPSCAEQWSGWGVINGDALKAISQEAHVAEALLALARSGGSLQTPADFLSVASWQKALAANNRLLKAGFPGLENDALAASDGVYTGRLARVHPSVQMTPPVFIGERAVIAAGAQLGPNVVIQHDCYIGRDTLVRDSLVHAYSFVGDGLEVDQCIVDRRYLVNLRIGSAVTMTDRFLLGDIAETSLRSALRRFGSQLFAALLLLVLLPLLVVTLVVLRLTRSGPVVHRAEVVRLPAESQPGTWRTVSLFALAAPGEITASRRADFFLRFVPGLLNVVRGDLCLVGMPARSRDEIEALDPDWQQLYLGRSAGLVREADLFDKRELNADDHQSAEAYYAAMGGFRHDLRLLRGYLAKLIQG